MDIIRSVEKIELATGWTKYARYTVISIGYLAAFLSLDGISSNFSTGGSASAWYLPAGVNFFIILAGGWVYAPLVILANTLSDLFIWHIPIHPLASLLASFLTVCIYLLAVTGLRRRLAGGQNLTNLSVLTWYVIAGGLSSVVVAAVGSGGFTLIGFYTRAMFWEMWLNWWVGDFIGILVVGPFLFAALLPGLEVVLDRRRWKRLYKLFGKTRSWVQVLNLAALSGAFLGALYLGFGSSWDPDHRLGFLCFVPIVWAGVSFGLPGAVTAVLFTNIGILMTAHIFDQRIDQLWLLETFNIILALTGLYVGAVVSERRQNQAATLRSEARFRALVDSIDDRILVIDRKMVVTNAFGRWLVNLNLTSDVYTGRTLQEIFGPNDGLPHVQAFKRAIQGENVQYEWSLGSPAQLFSWFQSTMSPLRENNGKITGVVTVGREVTAQRETLQALQQSKQQLETFFASSMDGFFIMMLDEPLAWDDQADKDKLIQEVFELMRVTRANDAFLTMYHARIEDLPAMTYASFFKHDPAKGREDMRRLFDAGHLHSISDERRFDGERLWTEGQYVCLYDEKKRVIGYFGVQRDISDQKETESAILAQNRYLYLLNEITLASLELHDLQSMQQILADRLGELFGADGCFITRWDEAIQQTQPAAAYGELRERYLTDIVPEEERTMTASVLAAGHPLVAEDVYNTPYMSPKIAALYPTISMLALPLVAGGIKMGAALVGFDQPHHFTAEEIRLGEQAAAQISLALFKERLNADLQRLAVTDVLTNVYNRRGFVDLGTREVERALRYKHSLSIILFDVDHFKRVNDRFGHGGGDKAVQVVAQRCREHLRKVEIIGRHGGDEFVILLPETDRFIALQVAERLRLTFEALPIQIDEQQIYITISAGVSTLNDELCDLEKMIVSADLAVYRAKADGRNCVRLSEDAVDT
jgi:diguanylate cyclase (GGDEF)-like protein/PAS domain S-box-containing protein